MKAVETIKTVALVTLVAVSLALSARIWTGAALTYAVTDTDEWFRLPAPEPLPVSQIRELFSPDRIFVHLGDSSTAFLPGFSGYERAWAPAADIISAGRAEAAVEHLPPPPHSSSIEFVFPIPIPWDLWVAIWWPGHPAISGMTTVDRIRLDLEPRPTAYLRSGPAGPYAQLITSPDSDQRFAELADLIADAREARLAEYVPVVTPHSWLQVAPDVYVPALAPNHPRILTQEEAATVDEQAALFFTDPESLLRITESNQATILTDGQRALRVYPTGLVEFSDPRAAARSAAYAPELIAEALEYVRRHGGIPPELHVISLSSSDGLVGFAYRHRGLPVRGEQGAITVRMGAQAVVTYRRHVRAPIGPAESPSPGLDWIEIINLLAQGLRQPDAQTQNTDRILDMYLAYILPDQGQPLMLVPVWIVELEHAGTIWFDIHTGEGWQWTGHDRKPF